MAGVRQLWFEVADVEESAVAGGAHHVVIDIHPVARPEHERRRRRGAGTDEHASLEMSRDLYAGQRENRRREIDEADELIAHRARGHI